MPKPQIYAVDFDGTILDLGYSVNYDRGAVRPALWVDSAP